MSLEEEIAALKRLANYQRIPEEKLQVTTLAKIAPLYIAAGNLVTFDRDKALLVNYLMDFRIVAANAYVKGIKLCQLSLHFYQIENYKVIQSIQLPGKWTAEACEAYLNTALAGRALGITIQEY